MELVLIGAIVGAGAGMLHRRARALGLVAPESERGVASAISAKHSGSVREPSGALVMNAQDKIAQGGLGFFPGESIADHDVFDTMSGSLGV